LTVSFLLCSMAALSEFTSLSNCMDKTGGSGAHMRIRGSLGQGRMPGRAGCQGFDPTGQDARQMRGTAMHKSLQQRAGKLAGVQASSE
jgi:hypothetical protein